jgi:hypothetical protein
MGSQRRGGHFFANLNRRRAATEPGNDEAARSVLVDGEGDLQGHVPRLPRAPF